MEVICLHGTENRLYELVAPLIMSPEVLRQNNNYPFKTTPQHTWHVCMKEGNVIGFMPAKNTSGGLYLDNYYIKEDDSKVLESLIEHILLSTDRPVTALCHKRHTETFRKYGFILCTIFAQYNKMQRTAGKGERDE
ncbi:MAG: hypothetical protein NC113_04350 [Bacteroides sp.]|nr:hypothetical protein [Bacteroides sp.]MCM1447439.1 hypothetical protein [Bacteroides sp.]